MFVVAGSLGAGKTSLINHLLRNSADTRLGVIVNEFGDLDVDGLLVAGQADLMFSAAGGCLCCAVDDDSVVDFLTRLTAPRAGIDVVLIEASGVADPVQLVQRVADALAAVGGRARYGGLVLLVDAEAPLDAEGDPLLERALASADLVGITKPDRASDGALARLRATVRSHGRSGAFVEVREGALDPTLLFDLRHVPDRQLSLGEARSGENAHLHAPYRTITWTGAAPMHPRRLAALLESGVPEAFRIKGFLTLDVPDYPRRWTLQRVGRQVRLTPGVPRLPGSRAANELVLIGPTLGGSAYDDLEFCLQAPHERVGADDLWGFERLVPTDLRPPMPREFDEGTG